MSSEVEGGASTSATPKKEQMDAQTKAMDLVAQGKRNLICQEVPTAVQQFQDACQILSEQFGEMAKECADAYYCYGSALLDLSRMEQDVLGNALEGVDVDADDEGGPNNKDQFEKTDKLDGDTPKDAEMAEEGEDEEEEEGEEGEEGEEEEAEEDQEGENPDDIPNLQLAWEMLELAKIIYGRDPSKESQLKSAEAYLKLGEVSLEGEQYDKAISDLEKCIEIQKEHLDKCDRAIAETYYQLGLSYQMIKDLDKAKESFTSAVTCLEGKIEKLKVIIEEKPPKSPSKTEEPADAAKREMGEIDSILPEIKEKIKDIEEEKKTQDSILSSAKEALGSMFAAAAADSTSETGFAGASSSTAESKVESSEPQKTMDISHLIRKKRKPEEEEEKGKVEEDLENKKQKHEGGGGDAAVNGVNGICEKSSSSSTSEAVAAT